MGVCTVRVFMNDMFILQWGNIIFSLNTVVGHTYTVYSSYTKVNRLNSLVFVDFKWWWWCENKLHKLLYICNAVIWISDYVSVCVCFRAMKWPLCRVVYWFMKSLPFTHKHARTQPCEDISKHPVSVWQCSETQSNYFQLHTHTLLFAATLTFLMKHARVYWLLCQLLW